MSAKNFMQTVIVTDAHYRAAVSAIRELGSSDRRVLAAYPEHEIKPLGAYSNRCADEYILKGEPCDALLGLARGKNAVIFPAGARFLKLMAARKNEFSPYALLSDSETLKNANDKTFVAKTAARIGIRVPETLDCAKPESLKYPVIVKYADGEALGLHAADRYAIAKSPEELSTALQKMSNHPVFVSEYVGGFGYGVSVLMDRNGRAVRIFCHERLREYPLTGGPSVMCRSVWCENMARDAVRLLGEMHFEGLAMVEFKGSPEAYALLEINPRVWGSYPLAYLAGARFSESYVKAANGETLTEVTEPDYRLGVRMQFFLSGARWAVASSRHDKSPAPLLKYCSDIVNPAVRHGLWSWRDIRPGLTYIKNLTKREAG